MIFRRVAIGLAAVVLVAAVVAFVVVRQIVFGGTPTIHHTGKGPSLAASPCATVSVVSGTRAFGIDAHNSSAAYEAHFLVAGQSVPGTVTGETGDVSGEFLLTPDTSPAVMSMKILIDLRTLDSGSTERDDHVRNDTLETSKYPFATFTVSEAQILPGGYSEGRMVTFHLNGNLTLHGVTRPATFVMQAKLQGDTATGSGTTLVHLQDYHMKTPITTALVTITVSKDITLTINFTAQKESCIHNV